MSVRIVNITHLLLFILIISSFYFVKYRWVFEGNMWTIFMPNPKELYMNDTWDFWERFPQRIAIVALIILFMGLIFGVISKLKSIRLIDRKLAIFYILSLIIGSTTLAYILPYTLVSDFGYVYSRLAHKLQVTGLPIYRVILFYHSRTFIIASFFLICSVFFWIRLILKIILSSQFQK